MKIFLSIVILMLVSMRVHAQDSLNNTFTHAEFIEGKRAIKNLIKFPKIKTDIEIDVICNGQATAKGRLRNAECSAPGDPDLDFTMAVSRRFNSSRLVPATVNGQVEEVDFQFTVQFKKKGKIEQIEAYTNNGKNVARLGLDYYSAQRYSPYVWPSRCRDWRQDDLIMEIAVVDAWGRAKEVNVVSAVGDLPISCQAALTSQLKNGRWIPAMHNDRVVESFWVNPIVLSSVAFKRQWKEQKSLQ